MDFSEVLGRVLSLLGEVKVGTLTTLDERGFPCSRWMTPTTLGRSNGRIYAVSAGNLPKTRQIRANPKVEWGFQSKDLSTVGRLLGLARIVPDTLLSAEVLEAIGPNLGVFWRINNHPKELVVIETEITSAIIFNAISLDRFEAEAPHGA